MTINQLTPAPIQEGFEMPEPANDGKVEFLGEDRVKYVSPPRFRAPNLQQQMAPPPYMQPPQHVQFAQNSQMPMQFQQFPVYQQQAMAPMMMMTQPQPQMMCIPQMPMAVQMSPPVVQQQQLAPVQAANPKETSPSQSVNVVVNSSPGMIGSLGGGNVAGSGVLVCPKCRKGIITREQAKLRRKMLIFLAVFCCPVTCCTPLLCIKSNFVDTCGACGKTYGHRGKKNQNNKVNAVKL